MAAEAKQKKGKRKPKAKIEAPAPEPEPETPAHRKPEVHLKTGKVDSSEASELVASVEEALTDAAGDRQDHKCDRAYVSINKAYIARDLLESVCSEDSACGKAVEAADNKIREDLLSLIEQCPPRSVILDAVTENKEKWTRKVGQSLVPQLNKYEALCERVEHTECLKYIDTVRTDIERQVFKMLDEITG
jgi:hypothetical protein